VWVTPFAGHRRLNRRGARRDHLPPGTDWRDEFVKMTAEECVARIESAGVTVDVVKERKDLPPALAIRRRREIGGPTRVFGYVSIKSTSPVPRPKAIGYGCHYGLGLLRPKQE
jgi:CRISPR-associated protein Csb2